MLSKTPNKLLILFLVTICVINIIQGYATELTVDEAYYWVYSNFLDWGYFDHPPMVAIWIRISKLFFSSDEISVRFFSAITLSITYYIIWLLIKHPKKTAYTWLFILIVLSTALFNVYGFMTVPDTPLLFFMAIFLLGYQQYLSKKNLISYSILAIAIAGMMYSKYQAVLVIIFVLFSNLKLLSDYKLWITVIVAILLFSPHLYWQYTNDFPSFRYHLYERSSNEYRIDYTTNHFLNLIAIIGFTFPIMYLAFYKNLKNKDKFQRALNYIVWGFAIFFFFSSFKNHVQAQWIVPISIPLIIITFNYLIEANKHIRIFKILAFITIGIIFIFRIIITQFEIHGNKKWVMELDKKLDNRQPLFVNSYQNTSTYWFYTGKRPYQYNTWWSRKNQYDLLEYNQNINLKNTTLISVDKNGVYSDSVSKKNKDLMFLKHVDSCFLNKKARFKIIDTPVVISKNRKNTISFKNSSNFDINSVTFYVVLKDQTKRKTKVIDAKKEENTLSFSSINIEDDFIPNYIQIIGKTSEHLHPIRYSSLKKCTYK